MQIDTSIYIKTGLLDRISEVSSNFNISLNRIIELLVLEMIYRKAFRIIMFSPVKYQASDDPINWHRLHVSFKEDIYEKALDLRKVWKMSVSYIIAISIERYLKEIIKNLISKKDADNCSHKYLLIPHKYRKLFAFTILWDKPPEKILKKLQQITS